MKIKIFTDGGARNNPGPAGIGVVIYDEKDNVIRTHNSFIGDATNNEAEYKALISGLKIATEISKSVRFFLDSELVVKQLNGEYKVKNKEMKRFYDEAQVLKMGFKEISFSHIRREENKLADKLVNEAIDEALR